MHLHYDGVINMSSTFFTNLLQLYHRNYHQLLCISSKYIFLISNDYYQTEY